MPNQRMNTPQGPGLWQPDPNQQRNLAYLQMLQERANMEAQMQQQAYGMQMQERMAMQQAMMSQEEAQAQRAYQGQQNDLNRGFQMLQRQDQNDQFNRSLQSRESIAQGRNQTQEDIADQRFDTQVQVAGMRGQGRGTGSGGGRRSGGGGQAEPPSDNDQNLAMQFLARESVTKGQFSGDDVSTFRELAVISPGAARLVSQVLKSDGVARIKKANQRGVVRGTLGEMGLMGGVNQMYDRAQQQSMDALREMIGSAPGDGQNVPGQSPNGMRHPGNIDLDNRKVFRGTGADGQADFRTENSISIGTNTGEVLIPTIIDGKQVSREEAIAHFSATGENLGTFDSPEAATAYAQSLHERQAARYGSARQVPDTGEMPPNQGSVKLPDGREMAPEELLRSVLSRRAHYEAEGMGRPQVAAMLRHQDMGNSRGGKKFYDERAGRFAGQSPGVGQPGQWDPSQGFPPDAVNGLPGHQWNPSQGFPPQDPTPEGSLRQILNPAPAPMPDTMMPPMEPAPAPHAGSSFFRPGGQPWDLRDHPPGPPRYNQRGPGPAWSAFPAQRKQKVPRTPDALRDLLGENDSRFRRWYGTE